MKTLIFQTNVRWACALVIVSFFTCDSICYPTSESKGNENRPAKRAESYGTKLDATISTLAVDAEERGRMLILRMETALEHKDWQTAWDLFRQCKKTYGSTEFVSELAENMKRWEGDLYHAVKSHVVEMKYAQKILLAKSRRLYEQKEYFKGYMTLQKRLAALDFSLSSEGKEPLVEAQKRFEEKLNVTCLQYFRDYTLYAKHSACHVWKPVMIYARQRLEQEKKKNNLIGLTAVRILVEDEEAEGMLSVKTSGNVSIYYDQTYTSSRKIKSGDVILIGTKYFDKPISGSLKIYTKDHASLSINITNITKGEVREFGELYIHKMEPEQKGHIRVQLAMENNVDSKQFQLKLYLYHNPELKYDFHKMNTEDRYLSQAIPPGKYVVSVQNRSGQVMPNTQKTIDVAPSSTMDCTIQVYAPRNIELDLWYRIPSTGKEWIKKSVVLDTVKKRDYYDQLDRYGVSRCSLQGYTEENITLRFSNNQRLIYTDLDEESLHNEIVFPLLEELDQKTNGLPLLEGEIYAALLSVHYGEIQFAQMLIHVKKISVQQ